MKNKTQRNCRLILVPCPYQGHITPMLQLATILHSKGFSITIAHTIFNSPNPQNHPYFSFLPITDGLSDCNIPPLDLITVLLTINDNCKLSFLQILIQLMENQPQDKITCIISDELMFFSQAVARDLKLPGIILRTTSAITSLARTSLIQLKAQGHIPFQESVSNDVVPTLPPLRFKDLPMSMSTDFQKFEKLMANAYNISGSSAIIWNTIDCLEQSYLEQIQEQCQAPIFPIGSLHLIERTTSSSLIQEDYSCIDWLDKQTECSVIFVSFGSIVIMDEKEVAEVAWGLANSNQPFLWVIRPGSIRGSDWIELLPQSFMKSIGKRGNIVKWAPQKEVLRHMAVGGFWSHCGWNSTLESIAEGVPMICRPCFGDQRVNTRFVCHVWRIGLELENNLLERGEIERAVRTLILDDDEGKDMRSRAKELKEKVALSISRGGSSYNSLNELVALILSF